MKILDRIIKNPKQTSIVGVIVMLVFLGLGIVKNWEPLPEEEPMGASISVPSSVDGSLVGYWTLNEDDATGTSIDDKSGNGNNGTSANTPSFGKDQNGVPNQAMTFDEGNNYVNCGVDKIPTSGNFTVSIWVKSTDAGEIGYPFTQSDLESMTEGVGIFYYTGGSIYMRYGNGVDFVQLSTPNMWTVNEWQYITLSYDGTYFNLYKDSLLIKEWDISGNPLDMGSGHLFVINGEFSNKIKGSISDALIYNKALSQEEISQLYLAGRTTAKVKVDAKNKVTNGDFDTDTTDWTALRSTLAIVDSTLQVTATDALGYAYQNVVVIPGHKYKLNFDYWNTTGDTAQYSVYDRTNSAWIKSRTELNDTQTMTTISNTFIAPAGCVSAGIFLESKSNTDITYFDNVELIDITNAITPKLQKGLILDMPLYEPYTEAGINRISNTLVNDSYSTFTDASSSGFTVTSDGSASHSAGALQDLGDIEVDKVYAVNFDLTLNSGTAPSVVLSNILNSGTSSNRVVATNGSNNILLVCTIARADATLSFANFSSATDYTISDLTVKELDGTTKDRTPNGNDGIVDGATIKYDGLVNTSDGSAYINQDKAYGTWEFDFNKGADGNTENIIFISSSVGGVSEIDSYYLQIQTTETIRLIRSDNETGGVNYDVLFTTGTGYIDNNTDYRFKIAKSLGEVITVYIKGGSFGWDSWTTINSVTDTSPHTTSNYFILGLQTNDTFSNLKIDGKRISLADATQSSGTWTTTGPAYDFDGTDDYIDMSALDGLIGRTYNFWINPKTTTEEIMLIEGSFYIRLVSGTLQTVNLGSTIYVNGEAGTTVSANEWSMISFTLNSGTIDWLSGTLGKRSTNYFDGQISGFKMWDNLLSESDIDYLYNKERIKY